MKEKNLLPNAAGHGRTRISTASSQLGSVNSQDLKSVFVRNLFDQMTRQT
jgi:hypothetical protein